MKLNLLLAALLHLPVIVNSQVSLNATMTPPINSKMIYYDAAIPNPPFIFSKSGTNNTWDFSAITPVPGLYDTTFVVSPSAVPLGSSFPTATHCLYDAAATPLYSMTKIDASGIKIVGAVVDVANNGNLFALIPNAPATTMSFPYVLGSSGTGNGYSEVYTSGALVGQPNVADVHFKVTLIGQHAVVASGNIILPSPTGTLDAILQRTITTRIDTVWIKGLLTLFQWVIAPGYPQTTIDSSFHWYTNNSLLPYANVFYGSMGLSDVSYFKSGNAVDVSETTANSIYNIYPNPVTDVLQFNLAGNMMGNMDFMIYNSSGQEVWNGKTNLSYIRVSALKQGIYLLQLIDEKGQRSMKRFVKN